MELKVSPIEKILADFKVGKMVILTDDEDRENEGDIILAAQFVTPQLINFMIREARGLICLAMHPMQVDRLGLPLMVPDEMNSAPNKTAFTVSIEASQGVTTGISAADRAHTIKIASSPQATPKDIQCPGHMFPIRARAGGVLERQGHTEAGVDLCILNDLYPSAVICEVMNEDGTMARLDDLLKFGNKNNISVGTIESLVNYRKNRV